MNAGTLTQRISLQSDGGSSVDAYGQAVRSWTTYATVWASVRPLSGREMEIGRSRGDVLTHRVSIRHRADVQTKHRILFGSRVLEIVSARNINEAGEELEIDALERSN